MLLGGLLAGCNGYSPEDTPPPTAHSPRGGDQAALAQAAAPFVASTTPGSVGYKIGPLDVLEITIFKAPDLSRSVQVGTNGIVNLPLIGDVPASGKTPATLERDIASKYNGGFLRSAQVTVFVKEYNSSRVTVDGAVKEPGVYPTRGHDTLMGAISLAKGLDKDTASTQVVLFRTEADGTRSLARYDLSAIRAGNSPDPAIQAGDVLVVEDSMTKSTFNIFRQMLPVASPLSYFILAL